MKKFIILAFSAFMTLASCTNKQSEDSQPKYLVLYYSQTGTTKAIAEEFQKALGADIDSIEVDEPYNGDFTATISRCQEEMANGKIPQLKPFKADVDDYDVVFLGYPVWFGTYARPISALVNEYKFDNKKVVTFCTFGSGGLNTSTAELKKALPNANVIEGYGVRTIRVDSAAEEIDRFLKENGYIEGEIEALPDFSEQAPVTDEERKIFDEACGDYQFPLGTPVTAGKREIKDATEYKFTVSSKGQDGKDVSALIYVIDYKDKNKKPVFTQVVR